MPTYDYECAACGHLFEHFQSMSSRRLRKCPDCGERKLERLFGTGAGVIFKGSGFYETDYKRAGQRPPKKEGSEAGSSSSEESVDTKKSDTRSAGAPSRDASSAKKGGDAKSTSGGD